MASTARLASGLNAILLMVAPLPENTTCEECTCCQFQIGCTGPTAGVNQALPSGEKSMCPYMEVGAPSKLPAQIES